MSEPERPTIYMCVGCGRTSATPSPECRSTSVLVFEDSIRSNEDGLPVAVELATEEGLEFLLRRSAATRSDVN